MCHKIPIFIFAITDRYFIPRSASPSENELYTWMADCRLQLHLSGFVKRLPAFDEQQLYWRVKYLFDSATTCPMGAAMSLNDVHAGYTHVTFSLYLYCCFCDEISGCILAEI